MKKTDVDISKNVSNLAYKGNSYENADLRKFPYPYSSMLSICSDIDDTTLEDFKIYHQFLNTKEEISHGKGLGLDVGDSMWLYMGEKYSKFQNGMHRPDEVWTWIPGEIYRQLTESNLDGIFLYCLQMVNHYVIKL